MATPDKKNRMALDFDGLIARARSWPSREIAKWRERFENIHQSNFELGERFANEGKLNDAMFRFKIAVRFKPDFGRAWYQLGVTYLRMGKAGLAKQALRKAMSLLPHDAEVAYMLATIDINAVPAPDRPSRMPQGMMENFFTHIATYYDQLEAKNQYQGPQIAVEKLRPYLPATSGLTVVDVGCGAGHAARLWRKVASQLVGVEATRAMAEQAVRSKTADDVQVFDAVHLYDIRQLPADIIAPASVDVVLLLNVAQFIGDLTATFARISTMLKPSGLLLVSVEPCPGTAYSVMSSTARFGHSDAYVAQVANSAGFDPVTHDKAALYPGIQLSVHVLRKRAAA